MYYLEILLKWVQDEYSKRNPNNILNIAEWELVPGSNLTSPQQFSLHELHENVDCGLFVIKCADYISDDLDLVTSLMVPHDWQQEMPIYRWKVGTDIIRGRLSYPI